MTRTIRILPLLVALFVVAASAQASNPPGTTEGTPLDQVFEQYCGLVESNDFLCKSERRDTLPQTQKWEVLNAYCTAGNTNPPGPSPNEVVCKKFKDIAVPFLLLFDHRTAAWRTGGEFTPRWRRTDFDEALGTPTVYMGKNDRIGVIVENTNPLLFRANRGDMKTEDAAEVKALQTFFTGLGNAFSGLAQSAAAAGVAKLKGIPSLASPTKTLDFQLTEAMRSEVALPDSFFANVNSTLRSVSDDVVARAIEVVMADASRASRPIKQLQRSIEDLATYRTRMLHTAHRLERGPAAFTFPANTNLERTVWWDSQFAALRAALSGQIGLGGCKTLLDAATPVLITAADKPLDVSTAAARFNQFYVDTPTGGGGTTAVTCNIAGVAQWLHNGLDDVTAKADTAASSGLAADLNALRAALATARGTHLESILVISRLLDDLLALRKEANDALGKEDDVRKNAENLHIVAERAREAGLWYAPAAVTTLETFAILKKDPAPGQEPTPRITVERICTNALPSPLTMVLRTKVAPAGDDQSVVATFLMKREDGTERDVRVRFRAGTDPIELASDAEGYVGCTTVTFDVANAAQAFELVPSRRLILSNRLWVMDEEFKAEFGKIRTTPIKVGLSSPFADAVPTDRSKETVTSFRIARRSTSLWSFGIGVIFTKVSSPTFAAIDDTPDANTSTAVTTDNEDKSKTTVSRPELKLVSESAREPRSGSRAVFGSYRIGGRFTEGALGGLGLQFGAGTSTDFPALFYGTSYNMGRFLTVGAGCSAQRITALDGFTAGESRVVDKDAIRTKKVWSKSCNKDAWYLSFSFNLNSLSLF